MSDRPIIKIAPVDLPSDMNIEERLVSLNDQVAALTAPPTIVSLSRIPSPKITSGLISNGTGVQFTFSQLSLSGIDGYRVYRNSSNSFVGATQLQYLKHSALLTTSVTVVDTIPAGTAEYYWVTAVSTSGLESAPTAAQATSVTSGSIVDSNGNLRLKNVDITNSTTGGSTSSTTPVVIPGMTKSVTTSGNNLFLHFTGTFIHSLNNGQIFIRFFADGGACSPIYTHVCSASAGLNSSMDFTTITGLAAGAHTIDVRWSVSVGTVTGTIATAVYQMEIIELG